MSAATRPVRVTIEGDLIDATPGRAVLVYGNGQRHVLDPSDEALDIEYLTPPRTWTDGDVVASDLGAIVYVRWDGRWHGYGRGGKTYGPHTDDDTNVVVGHDTVTVLRYQAGDQ